MSASTSLLDLLRQQTHVACDTLDTSVARLYPSFHDATSNQIITIVELQRSDNKDILDKAISMAQSVGNRYPQLRLQELAVEFAMVLLAIRISSHVHHCVHIQVNPFNVYSTSAITQNALRLRELVQIVHTDFDLARVCIKIPSTWEGLQACRILQAQNIKTLATTLFSFEQAMLAGAAGCHYVAPYVHELREQIDSQYQDPDPTPALVQRIYSYYRKNSIPTQVMPASVTSVEECFSLASAADYITIPPPLLHELASKTADNDKISSLTQREAISSQSDGADQEYSNPPAAESDIVRQEHHFRLAFTRSGGGRSEAKQSQESHRNHVLSFTDGQGRRLTSSATHN